MAKPKPNTTRVGNMVYNTTSNQLHMNTGISGMGSLCNATIGSNNTSTNTGVLSAGYNSTINNYINYTVSNGYIDYDIVEGYINESYYDVMQFCIANISTDTLFTETLETLDILKERRFTYTSQFLGQTIDIVALSKHKHKESILKTDKTYLASTLVHYKLIITKEILKEQIILDKILK